MMGMPGLAYIKKTKAWSTTKQTFFNENRSKQKVNLLGHRRGHVHLHDCKSPREQWTFWCSCIFRTQIGFSKQ